MIITNQGGVKTGMAKLPDIQAKIDAIQAHIKVPFLAMISVLRFGTFRIVAQAILAQAI